MSVQQTGKKKRPEPAKSIYEQGFKSQERDGLYRTKFPQVKKGLKGRNLREKDNWEEKIKLIREVQSKMIRL